MAHTCGMQLSASSPGMHPVVVFDGICNFCCASVQFVIRHDRDARFRFTPLQSPLGRSLLEQYGIKPDDVDTILLVHNDRAYERSDALLEIASTFRGPWKLLCIFRLIPRSFRDLLYRGFARNRYRLFGRRDQCLVPTDDIASRFVS